MNKAYEFISYPYESFALVPKTTSTLTIHDQDISLDDLLLEFTKFLRACDYIIDSDQYLSVVSDEDYEGLFDEDEEEEDWEALSDEAEEESLSWLSLPEVAKFGMKNDLDKAFDRKIDECWNPDDDCSGQLRALPSSINYEDVTRVEVIDAEGRAYVKTNVAYVVTDLQDEGRTLKVFLK